MCRVVTQAESLLCHPAVQPTLKTGELCLAQFSADNQWYRANVTSVDKRDSTNPSYQVGPGGWNRPESVYVDRPQLLSDILAGAWGWESSGRQFCGGLSERLLHARCRVQCCCYAGDLRRLRQQGDGEGRRCTGHRAGARGPAAAGAAAVARLPQGAAQLPQSSCFCTFSPVATSANTPRSSSKQMACLSLAQSLRPHKSTVQVDGTEDDAGYEAARMVAAATGGGKPLLADVQWRARAVPGMPVSAATCIWSGLPSRFGCVGKISAHSLPAPAAVLKIPVRCGEFDFAVRILFTASGRPLPAVCLRPSDRLVNDAGTRDTPPVPATAHVLLRAKPAEGADAAAAGPSINEQLLRAGSARVARVRGHQVLCCAAWCCLATLKTSREWYAVCGAFP